LTDFEASEQFSPFKKQDGEYVRDDNGKRIPENPKRALHPDDAMAFGPEVTDVDVEQLKAIEPLVKAQATSSRSSNRPTSSGLTMWLRRFWPRVEHLDPSPELQVTAGTEDRPRRRDLGQLT
jgi:hypothetical protein